eukprot:1377410-Heterocapsa_arctica.AAC.1
MGQKALRDDDVVSTVKITAKFDTANGLVLSNKEVTYWSEALKEQVTTHLLDEAGSVISIGKRCIHQGWSFHWPEGENPYFLKPDGTIILFDVGSDVPYLIEPDDYCSAFPATSSINPDAQVSASSSSSSNSAPIPNLALIPPPGLPAPLQ